LLSRLWKLEEGLAPERSREDRISEYLEVGMRKMSSQAAAGILGGRNDAVEDHD
jgi:hypothetical protein